MTVVTLALMGILALCVILHVPHVRPKTVQGSIPLSNARPATAVQNQTIKDDVFVAKATQELGITVAEFVMMGVRTAYQQARGIVSSVMNTMNFQEASQVIVQYVTLQTTMKKDFPSVESALDHLPPSLSAIVHKGSGMMVTPAETVQKAA